MVSLHKMFSFNRYRFYTGIRDRHIINSTYHFKIDSFLKKINIVLCLLNWTEHVLFRRQSKGSNFTLKRMQAEKIKFTAAFLSVLVLGKCEFLG